MVYDKENKQTKVIQYIKGTKIQKLTDKERKREIEREKNKDRKKERAKKKRDGNHSFIFIIS